MKIKTIVPVTLFLMSVFCFVPVTISHAQEFNVVWTSAVGVSVTGNTITKTAGGGWGSAGAAAVTTFSGDGGVDFGVTSNTKSLICGLATQNPDLNYTSINYGLVPALDSLVYIYESGISRGTFGTYQAGDRFRVERVGSTVYYKKNGVVFYTSTVPSSGKLLVDSAIYTSGGVISDAKIVGFSAGVPDAATDLVASSGNTQVQLTWTAPANNGTAITGYDVQYGTVASGAFGSTYSGNATPGATINGLTNGVPYQFRVVAKNDAGSSSYSNVVQSTPYSGLAVSWTAAVGVSVNGNSITKTAAHGWGNAGAASVTTFSGDGGVEFDVTSNIKSIICGLATQNPDLNYTSTNYGLVPAMDSLVYIYERGVSRGTFGTYQAGDRFRVERIGNTVYYKKNGAIIYTSMVLVPNSLKLLVDSAIYTNGAVISNANMVGFALRVPDAVNDFNVTPGDTKVFLNWSAPANNGSGITSYEVQYGTVASGNFNSIYTDDAIPGATITGLTNGVQYQFRVVAKNVTGTSGVSNVVTSTPAANTTTNVVWTDTVGVSVNGNSITKTAATGWGNGGAASAGSFGWDGGVDFTATQTTVYSMCGLSYQNTDAHYTSIDYAIHLTNTGIIYVYEKGTSRGSYGSYIAGDRFLVERVGSTVYYKKNGITFYTSTVSSSGRLLVDSAIYTSGGVISDAKLYGFNPTVPDAIYDLNASAVGGGSIQLTWGAPANNGSAITEYDVQYGTVASGAFGSTYVGNATPGATITGLTDGVEYQFRVVAKNGYGTSGYSNIFKIFALQRTFVSSDVTTNTTWTLQNSPYIITNNISVASGVTLTIQPGVVVKFDGNYYLQVIGTLNAQGTSGNIITFTSNKAIPAAQDWQYLYFTSTSGNSVLSYTKMEYAKYGSYMNGVSVPISNSTMRNNMYGLYLTNGASPNVTYNQIFNNTNSGIRLEGTGSSATIQNNSIFDNTSYGIVLYVTAGSPTNPTISNNSVYGHTYNFYTQSASGNQSGIKINARNNWWGTTDISAIRALIYDYTTLATSAVVDISDYLDGAGGNILSRKVISGPISNNTTLGVVDTPFYVAGNLTINSGVTLTIEPGVTLQFLGNYYLQANGTLSAQGQVNNLITFTSWKANPAIGDWQYMALSSTSTLNYAQVQYSNYGIKIDNTSPNIQNSLINHNNYGIYMLNGSTANIQYNKITQNNYGFLIYPSLSYTLNPAINFNDIYNNFTYNVYADGSQNFSSIVINAENNWWGTTDLNAIAAKIYDINDNANSPTVDFDPISQGADTIAITNTSATPEFFTPKSGQTTTIGYTLDKPADVTVKIYRFYPNILILTLVNNQARNAGANSEIWDGKDNQGQDLAKDVYYYTINARDSQNRYGEYDPVYVTGTVQVQNTSVTPANFNPYKGEYAVVSYDLVAPAWVTIKLGLPDPFQQGFPLIESEPRDISGNQETWWGGDDTPSNTFYFYAWTTILPDNAIVIRMNGNLQITTLVADPYAFYPLYGDMTKIEYAISSDANVSVDIIVNYGGEVVRNLVNNEPKTAGTYFVNWDGKDNIGRVVVTEGYYGIRVTATDSTGFNVKTRYGHVKVFK